MGHLPQHAPATISRAEFLIANEGRMNTEGRWKFSHERDNWQLVQRSHSKCRNETFCHVDREKGDYLGKFNKIVTVAPKMVRRIVKRIPTSQRKDFCM